MAPRTRTTVLAALAGAMLAGGCRQVLGVGDVTFTSGAGGTAGAGGHGGAVTGAVSGMTSLSVTITSSSSGGPCVHSPCVTGVSLASGCDPCVTTLCTSDAFCCNSTWDSMCVTEAGSACGCGTSATTATSSTTSATSSSGGALGAACMTNSACTSGYCVGGVCCDTACTGPCQSCTTGSCALLPRLMKGACPGGQACDSAGKCTLVVGEPCATNGQCLTDLCVAGQCRCTKGGDCNSGHCNTTTGLCT